ncbi:MAG: hypothetical protein K6G74_00740, partial [Bacilli bacterium]|nr:hypothetical protein [Bacilli bacterium]
MFSDGSFDLESILNTMNMVLLGVFIFILAILVISFLRGLRRGWVYGTYRLVFFAILVVAAFVSLKAVGNMLADIDLNTFGIPGMLNLTEISQDVTVNGATVTISAPITSIRETGTSLLIQLLQAYGIEADPETLLGLVLAIVLSFVCIILLIIEALIIWIVGGLLCTLLWHLLFKHFLSPKNEEGKRVKKLRIISAFEEVIVSATILAMFISPLTSLVNTTSKAISRLPKDENHQTLIANDKFYSVLTSVVDTYENSLLSKTFFSWYTDPNTGLTFDAALIDFITTVNIDSTGEKKISLMREFKNVVDLASSALTSGIFNAESVETINYATILTSDLIPTAIRVIGRSELIQTILPFGLQFAINLPEVAEYVMTEEGIDFSHYEPAATFDDLADLWTSVANSGLFDDIIDENGEFVDSDTMIDNVFKADYKSIFDSFFKIFSPDERKVLDDIIASALYVQAIKEYGSPATEGADDLSFGVKDLLPELTAEDLRRGANGYPVAIPDSIKSIDFGEELKVIFDSFYEIFTVDPSIAKIVLEPVLNPQGSSAPTGEEPFADTNVGKLLIAILENKDGVEHWIDGKEVEGASSDDLCLLDSNLIMNAVPKILETLEIGINQSFELVGDDEVDLSSIATSFKNKETPAAKKAAAKAEAQAIIDVLSPLVESEDGMALIKDPDGKPGLYFDKDNNFLGAKEGLLDAVADTVKKLDNSKVFSSVIPSVVEKLLAGDDSPLEELLGNNIKIDAHCVDNAGNSIFGHELSKLVRALGECQDVIVLASGMDTSSSDMHAMEKLFTQMCDLETKNHEKQLVKLFSAIATNKVINPVVEGKYNSNFYGLFKNIFEKMGIGSDDLNTTMEDIICDEHFDAENEVTAFVGLVEYICDKGLLGSISNLSLDSMANIKFGELFAKVDGSELLSNALGSIIDNSLHDNDIFTYINEGGETVALSFKNITNWTAEGEALDTMTKYAVQFGDLSNLNLESIDPDMMDSVLSYLAKSQLFVKTNANGTYDYNFPNYIASKLIEAFKGSGSMGTYFANLTETYDAVDGYKVVAAPGTANEDYSDFKASVLSHAVTGASSLTDIEAEQDVFIDEAKLFGRIIRNVSNSGAFELMSSGSSADFSKFKAEYFRALLNDMSESVLFGKTAVPAVLKVVVDTLSTSVDTFKNANIMYAYNCGESERLEIANSIADLLEVIVDPVSGLIGPSGEIDTGAFSNIEDLDPNHLISPLLKSLANNKVFTTLSDYQEDVAGITDTALDNQMLFVLKQSTWYGSDERAEAVYPYIKEMVANRAGGWESEIDRFVEIVDDLHVMGIKLDSSFDFDSYFQEAGYGVDVLSDLFIDINDSCLLFPGFPEKLNTALSTVEGSLASSGLNLDNANLYYLGKATVPSTTYSYATKGYAEDECYNLASVIRYGSALSGGINVNDLTAIPTGDIDNITELLGTFAKSHIFNSKKSATSDTVFQEFIAKILTTNEHVEDYIYDVSSPKDMANASLYSDATSKAKYLAATYYPEVDPLSTTADSIATDNITG